MKVLLILMFLLTFQATTSVSLEKKHRLRRKQPVEEEFKPISLQKIIENENDVSNSILLAKLLDYLKVDQSNFNYSYQKAASGYKVNCGISEVDVAKEINTNFNEYSELNEMLNICFNEQY